MLLRDCHSDVFQLNYFRNSVRPLTEHPPFLSNQHVLDELVSEITNKMSYCLSRILLHGHYIPDSLARFSRLEHPTSLDLMSQRSLTVVSRSHQIVREESFWINQEVKHARNHPILIEYVLPAGSFFSFSSIFMDYLDAVVPTD